jgi:hypothetical protein
MLMGILLPMQAPMLELMHKHMDAKGKQAKLKSPAELQAWPLPAQQPAERMAAHAHRNTPCTPRGCILLRDLIVSTDCLSLLLRRSCLT